MTSQRTAPVESDKNKDNEQEINDKEIAAVKNETDKKAEEIKREDDAIKEIQSE